METETKIVFRGNLREFGTWFEAIQERYPKATIEALLEEFDTRE